MSIWLLKCVEDHHRFHSLITVFSYRVLMISLRILPATYGRQHVQNKHCQSSALSVIYCISPPGWFIRLCFQPPLPDEWGLALQPPLGSWNRPSVGGQRASSDSNPRTLSSALVAGDPCCALGVLPPLLLSEQVLTDGQVKAQQLTVTFPRVEAKHRPWAAPNGVPNASGPERSQGEMKDGYLSRQMRKQICVRRSPELKTQLCTCSLLLVGISDREKSCFHLTGVCVILE